MKPASNPALPCQTKERNENGREFDMFYPGISMRDYFAAKAMQGLLSMPSTQDGQFDGVDGANRLVTAAWWYADAMLEARAK